MATPCSSFKVLSEDAGSHARRGQLELPHGSVRTPAFMPVGTYGTVKGLTPAQMGSIAFMGLGVWIVMKRRHIEPVRITVQRLREEEAANGIFPSPEDDDPGDAGASTG